MHRWVTRVPHGGLDPSGEAAEAVGAFASGKIEVVGAKMIAEEDLFFANPDC